ncbi:peptide chain release factor N(5)-glutamine methyltransferase [Alkalithermobacter paradoxus]|uniref:Release factor glutamine methyltransferase n=1 Tax=Alkalithermobacter paradoxus TaxID=29349 RepID=A0A1V4I6V6_9FIRM|nr:release factor glutamine methyltransferase [[Clostridium] thermoalcaliphilum]
MEMTIKEILIKSIEELKDENNIKLDIELILCEVLGVDRLYIHMNLNKKLNEDEIRRYQKMFDDRKKGRPVQYILGKQEFMGMDFFVKEGVLIPRPDTEILVEEVIRLADNLESPILLDIGTGSGAISVSLAKYIKNSRVYSLDISDTALEVGKINAVNNGVEKNITFIHSDLFSSLENVDIKFDIIVSNPPYIKEEDLKDLEVKVKEYEPKLALVGGEDGLVFYRNISKHAPKYLKENGILAYEVGHDQAEDVKDIMIENGFKDLRILKDLQGIDRVVIGVKI